MCGHVPQRGLAQFVALQIEGLSANHAGGTRRFGKRRDQRRTNLRVADQLASRNQFKGVGQERVANQHRRPVIEFDPHGWSSTSHAIVVHGRQIIMNKRIAMQTLERDAATGRAAARVDAEQAGHFPSPGTGETACRHQERHSAWRRPGVAAHRSAWRTRPSGNPQPMRQSAARRSLKSCGPVCHTGLLFVMRSTTCSAQSSLNNIMHAASDEGQ